MCIVRIVIGKKEFIKQWISWDSSLTFSNSDRSGHVSSNRWQSILHHHVNVLLLHLSHWILLYHCKTKWMYNLSWRNTTKHWFHLTGLWTVNMNWDELNSVLHDQFNFKLNGTLLQTNLKKMCRSGGSTLSSHLLAGSWPTFTRGCDFRKPSESWTKLFGRHHLAIEIEAFHSHLSIYLFISLSVSVHPSIHPRYPRVTHSSFRIDDW